MRNRFHEPRSDTPSPRRLDDVNANKSLYGNKRETPLIRCHEPANRPGRAAPRAAPRAPPGSVPLGDRKSRPAGHRETGDVGRAWRRETGYVGRAGHGVGRAGHRVGRAGHRVGRAGHRVGRAGHRVGRAGHRVGRAGRPDTGQAGPVAVRRKRRGHELGPEWPRHEWSGCPPGRKRPQMRARRRTGRRCGAQDGPVRGTGRTGPGHEPGPVDARDMSGVFSRPRHERSGCFPRRKRSEIPVGQQDGLRRERDGV